MGSSTQINIYIHTEVAQDEAKMADCTTQQASVRVTTSKRSGKHTLMAQYNTSTDFTHKIGERGSRRVLDKRREPVLLTTARNDRNCLGELIWRMCHTCVSGVGAPQWRYRHSPLSTTFEGDGRSYRMISGSSMQQTPNPT